MKTAFICFAALTAIALVTFASADRIVYPDGPAVVAPVNPVYYGGWRYVPPGADTRYGYNIDGPGYFNERDSRGDWNKTCVWNGYEYKCYGKRSYWRHPR